MIRFSCSRCGAAMEASEDQGSQRLPCPRCGQAQPVPTLLPVETVSGTHAPTTRLLRSVRLPRLPRFAPWRYGSPAGLFLALLLFSLPWVEVRCDRPIANSGTRTLAEQSGLQAAFGGYRENPVLQTARTELQSRQPTAARDELTMDWAPLMVLFPALLLGGILRGFLVPNSGLRSAGLMACSAGALLLLYLQAHWGFPLEQAVHQPRVQDALAAEMLRGFLATSNLVETRYTGWFWLTVATLTGSLLAAGMEGLATAGRQIGFPLRKVRASR